MYNVLNLENAKKAVNSGKDVYMFRDGELFRAYKLIRDEIGQWLIICTINDSCVGATNKYTFATK